MWTCSGPVTKNNHAQVAHSRKVEPTGKDNYAYFSTKA